jgi:glycosyltransferase involved in cell wall biosynthesis
VKIQEMPRLAAFGFRSFPPKDGSAGEDKFAFELYPRLAKKGLSVHVFTRTNQWTESGKKAHLENIHILPLWTVNRSGFDTLFHSMNCTLRIILGDIADVVHIHNGGNSIWAFLLRIAGKRVYITQDGVDWKRDKWPWYARLYLRLSSLVTAYIPNDVIFDNVYVKKTFQEKYNRKFQMIGYGSSVDRSYKNSTILESLSLVSLDYFLFIGRFIPDKGIHYLIEAYRNIKTDKKLVIVGGSPNDKAFEDRLKKLAEGDSRIMFPGFVYGEDVNKLINETYLYIQPSDVEGLSPVILQVMGLATPLLCSDIEENIYITESDALHFERSNINDLGKQLTYAINNPKVIRNNAKKGQQRILVAYDWDKITSQYLEVFSSP